MLVGIYSMQKWCVLTFSSEAPKHVMGNSLGPQESLK